MTEKEALDIVIDLALQSRLTEKDCDGDEVLLEQVYTQLDALNIVNCMYEDMENFNDWKRSVRLGVDTSTRW